MKVFVSWSGDLSRQVATLFKNWIEDVLQGTEAWISSDDIDKGSLWFGDINDRLEKTSVGVLCLTRENITAPWVLFEAGALSKGLEKNRVCPLLINLDHTDLRPPLSQFNGTLPTKADLFKLVKTINGHNEELELPEDKVKKAFNRWWEDFNAGFHKIMSDYVPLKEAHKRPVEDMIEEVLQIVRSLQAASMTSKEEYPIVHFAGHGSKGKNPFFGKTLVFLDVCETGKKGKKGTEDDADDNS